MIVSAAQPPTAPQYTPPPKNQFVTEDVFFEDSPSDDEDAGFENDFFSDGDTDTEDLTGPGKSPAFWPWVVAGLAGVAALVSLLVVVGFATSWWSAAESGPAVVAQVQEIAQTTQEPAPPQVAVEEPAVQEPTATDTGQPEEPSVAESDEIDIPEVPEELAQKLEELEVVEQQKPVEVKKTNKPARVKTPKVTPVALETQSPSPEKVAPAAPVVSEAVADVEVTDANPWGFAEVVSEGWVEVLSTPAGALVELDGKPLGKAPVSVKVAYGNHRVRASLSGYSTWEKTIDVRSERLKLPAELERGGKVGLVRVIMERREGDTLSVNGQKKGVLPVELQLKEGEYAFQVRGAQGSFTVRREVSFSGPGVLLLNLAQ